jgi:glycosyltransferase involved in cell wall biosynthesis
LVELQNIKKEIIVINDGSNDGTENLLKKIENIKLINHKNNKGKGEAIKSGLKHANGDIVLIQDADLEYDPNDYLNLIKPFESDEIKVVYGSRRLKKNNYSTLSFYLGGIVLTKIANFLYSNANLTDMHTCYKLFRKDLIDQIELESKGFEFCPEITAKILNKNIFIKEVGISYFPRNKTEGKKIQWKDGFIAIYILLKYKFFT